MNELPPWTPPSTGSLLAFLAIVAFVVGVFLYAARRARLSVPGTLAGLAAWLGVSAGLAGSGLLHPGPMPPPLMLFLFGTLAFTVALALSPIGRRLGEALPLGLLIGVQAFRLPLELVLHAWYGEGVIPVQMTFEGLNFDIITGAVALVAGLYIHMQPAQPDHPEAPRVRTAAWTASIVGSALLLVVIVLAMLSAPGPLHAFTEAPPLQLPLHVPTVWIATVCVAGALFFHILAFRRLRAVALSAPGNAW